HQLTLDLVQLDLDPFQSLDREAQTRHVELASLLHRLQRRDVRTNPARSREAQRIITRGDNPLLSVELDASVRCHPAVTPNRIHRAALDPKQRITDRRLSWESAQDKI